MRGKRDLAYALLACGLLCPAMAGAQSATTGAIAGVVRDASGAVLPGVTVEAASPALIEKVRSVVADDTGTYKIIELRPGVYTVTFTLPGFSTVRREGLELTTGFTATVNADMAVGQLEETVTVTGATPVVDVQNVRQQTVFRKELQEAIPLGRSYAMWASIIPGMTLSSRAGQDVGGVQAASTYMGIHGGRPANMALLADGFNMRTGSVGFALRPNAAAMEETTVQTAGVSAESATGTVQMNLVPREGGNTYRGIALATYGPRRLQAKNIDADLVARGVSREVGDIVTNWSAAAGVGGPLKRDRLWFYAPFSWTENAKIQPGNYWNATQTGWLYTPDLNHPAASNDYDRDTQVRLTVQAAKKHKVSYHVFIENNCQCVLLQGSNAAPEAILNVK